ncbi:MAG TPA: hypothetical protein VFG69_12165 [Nannocystaceae bacterium]|nr:hypothetical protein [Nannocystaceae bacterium]
MRGASSRPHLVRRVALHLSFAASIAIACGGDDAGSGGSSGAGSEGGTCSGSACGGSTSTATASTDSGSAATDGGTTMPPGESSTMPAEGSSMGVDECATDTCTACFECTYDGACDDEQSQCSVDPACSIALICVRDCIAQSADPTTCVAACDCPDDGPLPALLACATGICVPNGSCPALSC